MNILGGGEVPSILRRKNKTYFTQVGEAYMYEIMYGKFMEKEPVMELH